MATKVLFWFLDIVEKVIVRVHAAKEGSQEGEVIITGCDNEKYNDVTIKTVHCFKQKKDAQEKLDDLNEQEAHKKGDDKPMTDEARLEAARRAVSSGNGSNSKAEPATKEEMEGLVKDIKARNVVIKGKEGEPFLAFKVTIDGNDYLWGMDLCHESTTKSGVVIKTYVYRGGKAPVFNLNSHIKGEDGKRLMFTTKVGHAVPFDIFASAKQEAAINNAGLTVEKIKLALTQLRAKFGIKEEQKSPEQVGGKGTSLGEVWEPETDEQKEMASIIFGAISAIKKAQK